MKWIYFFVCIAGTGCFTLLTRQFYNAVFTKIRVSKDLELLSWCCCFTLTVALQLYVPRPEYQLPGGLALLALLSLLYQDYRAKKIFSVLSLFLFSTLTHYGLIFVSGRGGLRLFSDGTFSAVFGMMLECLLLYAFVLAATSLQRFLHANAAVMANGAAILMGLLCPACLLWLSVLSILSSESRFDALRLCLFLLTAVNLLALFFHGFRILGDRFRLASCQNKYYENQLALMEASEDALKSLRHDLKNHLLTLSDYLNRQEPAKAQAYLHTLTDRLESGNALSKTGNGLIDSLINYKAHSLCALGVQPEYLAEIPAELHIAPFDLTVILGNLLDNAAEALKNLPAEREKQLSVTLKYDCGRLVIKVSNTYDGFLIPSAKGFFTRKADRVIHGIGLKNVRAAVCKYDGIFETSHDQNTFTACVILYEKAASAAAEDASENASAGKG